MTGAATWRSRPRSSGPSSAGGLGTATSARCSAATSPGPSPTSSPSSWPRVTPSTWGPPPPAGSPTSSTAGAPGVRQGARRAPPGDGRLQGQPSVHLAGQPAGERAGVHVPDGLPAPSSDQDLGRARFVEDDAALIDRVRDPEYDATVERVLVFEVVAWDVNCRQHITPRYAAHERPEAG